MPTNCSVASCTNISVRGGRVSFHRFPKDPVLKRAWRNFVLVKRKNWEPAVHSNVCSEHFDESCFDKSVLLRQRLGYGGNRPLLPGSIPTIQKKVKPDKSETGQSSDTDQFGYPIKRKGIRGGYEKRERKRIVDEILEQYEASRKTDKTTTSQSQPIANTIPMAVFKNKMTTGELHAYVAPQVFQENGEQALQQDSSDLKKRKITFEGDECLASVVKTEPLDISELFSSIAKNTQVKLESVSSSERLCFSETAQEPNPASLTGHLCASFEVNALPRGLGPGSLIVAQGPTPGSSSLNMMIKVNRSSSNMLENISSNIPPVKSHTASTNSSSEYHSSPICTEPPYVVTNSKVQSLTGVESLAKSDVQSQIGTMSSSLTSSNISSTHSTFQSIMSSLNIPMPSSLSSQNNIMPSAVNAMTSNESSTMNAMSPCMQSTENAMSPSMQSTENAMSPSMQSTENAMSPSMQSTENAMSPSIQSTENAMSPSMPSTGNVISSNMPSTRNVMSSSMPSSGNGMSSSMPSTVDMSSSMPFQEEVTSEVKTVYLYIPRPTPDHCDVSTQTMDSDFRLGLKEKLDLANVYVKRENRDCAADQFSPESVGKSNIKDLFKYYTGFSFLTFTALFNFLFPNSKENPVMYTMACEETEHMPLYNQLFLVLCRLRQGFGLKDLAFRFKIQPQTACVIFDSVVHYMYLRMKYIPLWPQRPTILSSLLQSSQPVMSVFGFIELKTLPLSDEEFQPETCPDQKPNSTLQGLVSVNPKGDVSFVSVLFSGKLTEKEICKLSGFLGVLYEQKLKGQLEDGDSIIGTKLLMMKKDFSKIGLTLKYPSNMSEDGSDGKSLHTSEVVEQRIEKIREFKLIGGGIPASLFTTINEVWFVCAVLTNFQTTPITSCLNE